VERSRRVVRFARLIHTTRPRLLAGPAVRAAFGGNLSLTWLPHRVVRDERRAATRRHPRGLSQSRVATRGRSRDWLGNADPAMTTQDLAALRWVSDQ
jgi:hypothetical protein